MGCGNSGRILSASEMLVIFIALAKGNVSLANCCSECSMAGWAFYVAMRECDRFVLSDSAFPVFRASPFFRLF